VPDPGPETAECPPIIYRVGRAAAPLKFSEIDPLDAALHNVGNRFDVVGSGVLYAATEKVGAYKETIASLRTAPSSLKYAADSTEHFMNLGSIPRDWRDGRRMVSFGLREPLPFLDVEQDATLSHLTIAMAKELQDLGITTLDSGLIRGSNRLLTRASGRTLQSTITTRLCTRASDSPRSFRATNAGRSSKVSNSATRHLRPSPSTTRTWSPPPTSSPLSSTRRAEAHGRARVGTRRLYTAVFRHQ
jgi:hypothetical protein